MTAGLALGVAGVNALVGLFGVWRWYRVLDARRFWPALRVAQAAAGAYAVYGGVLVARGDGPDAGLERAADLEGRPDSEQRSVVRQVLRRELGVMAAAALVVAFLALRAAGTA